MAADVDSAQLVMEKDNQKKVSVPPAQQEDSIAKKHKRVNRKQGDRPKYI